MFSNKQLLCFIEENINEGLDLVITSVIQTAGSTYAKPGNIFIVNSKGEYCGVLGSPYLHNKIIELSNKTLRNRRLQLFESIPKDESTGHGQSKFLVQPFFHDNLYGALGLALQNFDKTLIRSIKHESYCLKDEITQPKLENEQFYQTIECPYSLLIFGSGAHVTALISFANLMGWKTTVVDMKMKNEFVNEADELITLKSLEDMNNMNLSPYNAAVILSHSPTTDHVYLEVLLNSKVEYIGMMGNKKNMKRLTQEFNLENSERFFAPIGLDIGGNTSQTIALSICAQIEAKKNNKI